MHFFCAIGESIEEVEAIAYLKNLYGNGCITERELHLCSAALSNSSLSAIHPSHRASVRADIFKQLILSLM